MATYTHPVTGEELEYIPYVELDDEQRKLVDSSSEESRVDAGRRRLGLDKLVNDPEWWVREAVAWQGFGLEKLVTDRSGYVRWEVAWQGFGLDALAEDENLFVQEATWRYLEKTGMSLEEWVRANPDKCALPENRRGESERSDLESAEREER